MVEVVAACLKSVGQPMPFDRGAIPVLEVGTIVKALRQHSAPDEKAVACKRSAIF